MYSVILSQANSEKETSGSPNWSRTYNLPITSLYPLPLNYRSVTNLLLTEFEVRTVSYGPSFSARIYGPSAGHESKRTKRGFVTYSTDRENEVCKIFIISQNKLLNFAGRTVTAKLTNLSVHLLSGVTELMSRVTFH